jgi:hypothetical protein
MYGDTAYNFVKKHGIEGVLDLLRFANQRKPLRWQGEALHEDPAKLCRVRMKLFEFTLRTEAVSTISHAINFRRSLLLKDENYLSEVTRKQAVILDFVARIKGS